MEEESGTDEDVDEEYLPENEMKNHHTDSETSEEEVVEEEEVKTKKISTKSKKALLKSKLSPTSSRKMRKSKSSSQDENDFTEKELMEIEGSENVEKSYSAENDDDAKTGKKKSASAKREAIRFNDKNVDCNLYENDPCNVIRKTIKISGSVLLTCRNIDASEGKSLGYDYAALTFQRKTKNGNVFEFALPLGTLPNIITGLKLIMKENPKFFHKYDQKLLD